MDKESLRALRGAGVGTIFQDPLSSLNPVQKVGHQIREAVVLQRGTGKREAKRHVLELLAQVGIPDPRTRYEEYPHQLSGGMRQRAMIAIALAGSPPLLIADEPTTALDVTVQAQILELIARLRDERQMGVLMITHDLGIVAGIADRVMVMYAGRIVESGSAESVLREPRHRYTLGLLQSVPRLDSPSGAPLPAIEGGPPDPERTVEGCAFAPRCHTASDACAKRPPLVASSDGRMVACRHPFAGDPLADAREHPSPHRLRPAHTTAAGLGEHILEVRGLEVVYDERRRIFAGAGSAVRAVNGVDLELRAGTTLGLVGESGSGKTTLGRAVMRLIEPTRGSIKISGRELVGLSESELRPSRREFQIVFQDPRASLNPRHRVAEILTEPLEIHGLRPSRAGRAEHVGELLELVGLPRAYAARLPHELSGGQRQRVGIARALVLDPKLIVLDEPVSSLDVSVRAQILNLLERLQGELGIAYLFIAHDLAVVRHVASDIAVMYIGQIVESGPAERVYTAPLHPYTAALLSAVPVPDVRRERRRRRILLPGDPADPRNPPTGCPFHTRCWLRQRLGSPERCVTEPPRLGPIGGGHRSACHFADELARHTPPNAPDGAPEVVR
jgi:peptide/nickel transport system ATP-binding protein